MKQNLELPAFPQLHEIDGNWIKEPKLEYSGLTKREYVATKLMNGIMRDGETTIKSICQYLEIEEKDYNYKIHYPIFVAKIAIKYADTLLNELSNEDVK